MSLPAGTIMPLAGSMLIDAPVTRSGRYRNGIHGASVSGPESMWYCWVTTRGVANAESVSAGSTPPEGRNVRSNDQPEPS